MCLRSVISSSVRIARSVSAVFSCESASDVLRQKDAPDVAGLGCGVFGLGGGLVGLLIKDDMCASTMFSRLVAVLSFDDMSCSSWT